MATSITGPTVITQPGTYVLTGDIIVTGGDAIVIQSSNVTIDLNGFTISGSTDPSSQSAAIRADGYSRITVQNGAIEGFAYGVYLADPTGTYNLKANNLVQDLVITDSTYRGIKVEGSGNIVRDNSVSHIGGATFVTNSYAMGIETYGANGLIASNLIHDVRGQGADDLGEGVGICLSQNTTGTSVINNVITEPSLDFDSNYGNWPAQSRSSYGIFIGGNPRDVTVDGNILTNFFYGITYGRTAEGSYGNNTVTNSFIPFYLLNNDGVRISDLGGNTSDLDGATNTYGRPTPGAIETVEADYLSIMQRVPGNDQYHVIHNPTAGSDVIVGTSGNDLVDYWISYYLPSASVTVDLEQGTATGWGGSDTLVSIEGVKGTINDDYLYGNTLSNLLDGSAGNDYIFGRNGDDFIFGGEGNDHLFGGLGADALDGGSGIDFARYDDAAYGNLTISLQVPIINTGAAAGDTFTSIEGVMGSVGNDTIYGDIGDNFLYGVGGHDMIFGSLGADYIDGGDGFDYTRFDDAGYAGVTADLANIVPGTGAAAGDTYVNVEGLILTQNNDIGYGNEQDNYLYGFGGDDFLDGRAGNDFLYGAAGNDTLVGGAGNDTLIGGPGNDILTGGSGLDSFVFAVQDGIDHITDFQGGTGLYDIIDLRAFNFTSFSQALSVSYQQGLDLIIQFDANNYVVVDNFYRGNFAADDVLLA